MTELSTTCSTLSAKTPGQEAPMIRAALWEEIHRLFTVERQSKSAIARALDLDVKTVRRCLAQTAWRPYHRTPDPDALLAPYRAFLDTRAPAVGYSAQILYQELTQRYGYTGSYDTVKRFVYPHRETQRLAERLEGGPASGELVPYPLACRVLNRVQTPISAYVALANPRSRVAARASVACRDTTVTPLPPLPPQLLLM